MQQLNRIELVGIVGYAKTSKVGDNDLTRFTLATNLTYRNPAGEIIIETTWHNVTAFRSASNRTENLSKGTPVRVTGRIRNLRYTASDGEERISSEVVASSVEVLEEQPFLEAETA